MASDRRREGERTPAVHAGAGAAEAALAADSLPGSANRGARESMQYHGLQYRFLGRYRVIWGALALLALACVVTAPAAFNSPSLKVETPLVSVLLIASLGQLLVVMMGGFDLSVASVMTFSSTIMVMYAKGANDKAAIGILIALLAAMGVGLINGLLVGYAGLTPLIVTLAVSSVVSAFSLLISGEGVSLSNYLPPANVTSFSAKYVGSFSTLVFFAVGLIAIQALILRGTRFGRRFIAAGTNPVAARIVGIHVLRYQIGSYVAAGFFYGTAGILLAAWVQHPDLALGDPYLLSTFIVVALGGALFAGGPASVLCAAGGGAFLTLLNHFLAIKGFPPGVQSLIAGLVLIVAVALVTALRGKAVLGTAVFLNGLFGSEEVRRYFQGWRSFRRPLRGGKGAP